MEHVSIELISGVSYGNAQDFTGKTGCTVVICPRGAVGGVDVRGGAPGTRETDLLRPENLVDKVHAVFLSGGSAFGLDVGGGVMRYLSQRGIGLDVGVAKVPIVCGAVLFDLAYGSADARPDADMGYAACVAAEESGFETGSVGAGTGATVGKILGMKHAAKGGLGAACLKSGDLLVGAVVAVNALGDVVDPDTGRIIAGAWMGEPSDFVDSCQVIIDAHTKSAGLNMSAGNTTIGCVITNAELTKAQATKVAQVSHDGYARTIRPVHTMLDGDTVFCLATGDVPADVTAVSVMAVAAVELAVVNAVARR